MAGFRVRLDPNPIKHDKKTYLERPSHFSAGISPRSGSAPTARWGHTMEGYDTVFWRNKEKKHENWRLSTPNATGKFP